MRIKETISRNSYESYQASEEIIDKTPSLLRITSLSLFNQLLSSYNTKIRLRE